MPVLYPKNPVTKPTTFKKIFADNPSAEILTFEEGFQLKRGQRVYYTMERQRDPITIKCTAAQSNAVKYTNISDFVILL